MPVPLTSAADRRALGRARSEIAAHEREFRALEARALALGEARDDLGAVAWAQIAADAAARRHAGLLAAPALERLVNDLGRKHVPGRTAGTPGDTGRVLHVLTEAYPVGGHSRVAVQWVERDERTPTVVLLRQRTPVPQALAAATSARGGRLVEGVGDGDLFARARTLRALAEGHDLVVLHHHMHDALPALAFADPSGRAPTVVFEHANAMLWLGSAAADLVACFRDLEAQFAPQRRGVAPERVAVLPLPASPRALPDRDRARDALGLDRAAPVILAVANDHKVQPVVEPSFATMLDRVLTAVPRAVALVVGPRAATLGAHPRIVAPGAVADIAPHLAAADLLLDSWPVTGGMTVLDAAMARLPVLSLDDGQPGLRAVRPAEPALDAGLVRAADADALAAAAALLADRQALAARGEALRHAVDARHGAGWTTHLESLAAAAAERAGTATPPVDLPPAPVEDWECVLHLMRSAAGHLPPFEHCIAANLGDLPASGRPTTEHELAILAREVLAAAPETGRRAVAAPAVEAGAVLGLVDEVRRLRATGEIASCTVLLPAARLDEGVALLERALASGEDVDLDVVVGSDARAVAGPADLVLGA